MLILGIESSCDDTSVALIEASARGFKILAEKTASQIEIHKKYGGVVPEIAGRMHAENISPLIEKVHESARITKPDIISVTSGPGLITGLMVGVEAAKTLAYLWNVPVIGVNHIEGHIHSVEIKETSNPPATPERSDGGRGKIQTNSKLKNQNLKFDYPAIALIASGGHTELILIKKRGQYKKIGATLDDAAGECFDKVAKLLGFDYPGGPKISKFAETGNPEAIKFPRPMLATPKPHNGEGGLDKDNLDFSFAGLKTSALYWLRDHGVIARRSQSDDEAIQSPNDTGSPRRFAPRDDLSANDFCASFEQAIIDVLVGKTLKAVEKYKPKSIILAGGVSANKKLHETLSEEIKKQSPLSTLPTGRQAFYFPLSTYCMDNAAMIAVAGYYHAIKKDFTPWQKLKANPEWEL